VIIEHALLPVIPGREAEFEAAMGRATEYISATPGFISIGVSRCVEQPNTYLLFVEWERLEDHTEGFRGSEQYQQWRALLHHFYDPFPEVVHFVPIDLPAS
jgi:heme-degrading monooxygenase HmoA